MVLGGWAEGGKTSIHCWVCCHVTPTSIPTHYALLGSRAENRFAAPHPRELFRNLGRIFQSSFGPLKMQLIFVDPLSFSNSNHFTPTPTGSNTSCNFRKKSAPQNIYNEILGPVSLDTSGNWVESHLFTKHQTYL